MKNILNKFSRNRSSIAAWGWWQGGNLGDNWIKQVMAKAFKGVRFIDTDTSPENFKKYKFVICGGGGLFIRGVHHDWEKATGVPFGAIGLGAEFKHKTNAALKLSQAAKFFFVRDLHSKECMNLDEKHKSYDMTFFDPLPILKKTNFNKVLFIWRDPEELLAYDDFNQYIGKPSTKKQWMEILDNNFQTVCGNTFSTTENPIRSITDDVGFVVSSRYHGILAAIQRGIPCIGIDLCPKTRALLRESDLEKFCLKLNEVDALEEKIREARDNALLIRQKQLHFTEVANTKVVMDVQFALNKIARIIF